MSAQQSAIAALGRTGPILKDAPEASRAVKRNIAASRKSAPPEARKRLDRWMLGGILITVSALAAGIAATRVPLSYFFQPSGVLIVIGGTLGATVVTTPKRALQQAARRVLGLVWERGVSRARLVEEIMSYIRVARTKGLLGIEPMIRDCRHELLRESLTLALDVQKEELQSAIETKMRLRERRGEEDARTLETAGGFAPTIGVLGTVVGLIDVLRRLSDLTAVAGGVGTAFASTLYGIGLANLLLLPLAHRIRAAVAADFETEELILEGVGCIFDGVHPALAEERLNAFLDQKQTA
jgi:chemotaxis protein MotA